MAMSCGIATKSAKKICSCCIQKKKSTLFSPSLKSATFKSLHFLSYLAKEGCRFLCHALHCLLSHSQHLFIKLVKNLFLMLTSLLQKTELQVIRRLQLLHQAIVGRVISAVFQASTTLGNVSMGVYRSLARTINNYYNSDNGNNRIFALPQPVCNSTQQHSGDYKTGGGIIDYSVLFLSCAVRCVKWIIATTYGCIHAIEDLFFDLRVLIKCMASFALNSTYSAILSVPSFLIHYLAVSVVSLKSAIAALAVSVANAGNYIKETLIPLVTKNMSDFADQGWCWLKNNSSDLLSDFFKERVKISVTCFVVIGVWSTWTFSRRRRHS